MLRIVAFALCLLVASVARASILPILDEQQLTGESPWWVVDAPGPEGPVSSALSAEGARGAPRWVAPATVARALDSVSRVLRARELTPTNASQLAGLLGASRALVGAVRREEAPAVPWLGLRRASLVLQGVLVDARSGLVIREVSLRAVAFGTTDPEASQAAAELLARFVDQAAADVSRAGSASLPLNDAEPVVVVRSDNSALPYVAVRAALREVHAGVVELTEVWATGGHVAMRVSLDEAVTWETFRTRVVQLQGAALADVIVLSVEDLGAAGLLLVVGTPPALPESRVRPAE